MGYLKDFRTQILNRDFAKFMQLWEEFCICETIDVEEVITLLKEIKASEFTKPIGKYVETLVPLWNTVTDFNDSYVILSLIMDLQTTNTKELAKLAHDAIAKKHGEDALFQERIKKVGLKVGGDFQGVLARYDILAHIKKGNFVFHSGGWGVGEIMDFSPVQEQLVIEFENVGGVKHVTFSNALKNLIPLKTDHFLARRFANPDKFEQEAKQDPVGIFKLLLKDLGPLTASEIKDHLCELVIPEKEWSKWWQMLRAKLKKDTEIQTPENLRDPFILRKQAVTHESKIVASLEKKMIPSELILTCYNFIRDYGNKSKGSEVNQIIQNKLHQLLKEQELTASEKLEVYFCLNLIQDKSYEDEIKTIITSTQDLEALIKGIEIIALKKQTLIAIKKYKSNWSEDFIILMRVLPQGMLKDYIYKELTLSKDKNLVEKTVAEIAENPAKDPEFFFWYFSKLISDNDKIVASRSKNDECTFAESFLVLLHSIENNPNHKDLVKRMYVLLSNGRYALVRQIFKDSSLSFTKEFLLLASKCHTLNTHDQKILLALAEVAQPSLKESGDSNKTKAIFADDIIWTTQEGLLKIQERVKLIGTKEVIENAREVEAARALGDLRENSEYKYAVEKRARLQNELKSLTKELGKARALTKDDIIDGQIGIGSVVDVAAPNSEVVTFTILGPWDANPDDHIYSYQSKLAQSMIGLQKNDKFKFKDEEYTVVKISSIFDK